jgi:hypothetical protein
MFCHRPLLFFAATATSLNGVTSIGCINPFTGISKARGLEIGQSLSVSLATPVLLGKDFNFQFNQLKSWIPNHSLPPAWFQAKWRIRRSLGETRATSSP